MDIGRHNDSGFQWFMLLVPVRTLNEALNLAHRFREGKAFRLYVRTRLWLVLPMVLLIVVTGGACAAGFFVYLTGVSGWLALPAIILMPLILVGSVFVQAYVFASWLEMRAMSRTLGQRARAPQGRLGRWLSKSLGADMIGAPQVPWTLVCLFLIAPLGLLATFAANVAVGVAVLGLAAPVAYAICDR